MTVANWLTIGRILLVPVFVILLVYYEPGKEHYRYLAFWIFVLAALTDAVDGYIARRWNQVSSLGEILDPLADKVLVLAGYITIFLSAHFALKPPTWIVIVIVLRDLFILIGLLLIFFTSGHVASKPNYLGKMTTFFQMLTLAGLMLFFPWSPVLWYITVVLTVSSGTLYLIREGIRLNDWFKKAHP